MTSTSTGPAGSSNTHPVHRAQTGAGHFMLTLCRLAAPVSIRPPQSPHLKSFTFFTSRARQPDGSEPLCLHRGYFESLADAERWADAIRGRFPDAIATIAPAPASQDIGAAPGVTGSSELAPAKDASLTDTQVMRILDT